MIIGILLLLMLLVGGIQLLHAFVMLIATPHQVVRKHYIIYFMGVFMYFVSLVFLKSLFDGGAGEPFAVLYFFSGAIALGIYHTTIVFRRDSLT